MLDQSAQPRLTAVQFKGTGMEFFRIWIVNLALTIITFGIYSAWAKVRTLQYFYGNTQVLGQSFQFHATGGQIFKSRVIAFLIFMAYQLIATLLPVVGLVMAIGFIFLVPWLVNAGMRFNARMSSWRNVRFDFQGSYGRALMVFFVWPILGLITLGVLMPKAVQRADQYVVEAHRYGDEPFEFTAKPAHYHSVIWGLILIYVAIFVVLGVAIYGEQLWIAGIAYLAIYIVAFTIKPLLFNIYWQHVKLKGNGFLAAMPLVRFIWVVLSNSFAVILSVGLLYPWAKVRMAKFTANSLMTSDIVGSIDQIAARQHGQSTAFGEELSDVFDVDVGFGV